ncbi:hypothetical protein V8D89_004170 [Ganoderma adspersum]
MRQHMRCSKQPSGPVQSSAGSIDLTTGLFQRSEDVVEHQRRIRVIQACEKCRRGKSRCNGKHPCERCLARRFRCEYAPERRVSHGVWLPSIISPNRATASSATSDYAITDPSTPASSDSSGVASDHQRFESTTPSTLSPYAIDISSTQSSPTPAHHGAPEIPRPRSAMAIGQNSSGSSCNASDSSSDVRAAFTRRPPPRPLDPTRDCRRYPPLFSLPIETSVHYRAPLPTALGPSNSRIILHNSDVARGALTSPYSPPIPQGVGNIPHPSPAIAGHSSFQSTKRHAMSNSPEKSFPIVSLSFASGAAGSSTDPVSASTALSSDDAQHMCMGAPDVMASTLKPKAFG